MSQVSKRRVAVSTNSTGNSVHQHLCFLSGMSIRSLAWSLALAERPPAGQWTAPGSSHWTATQGQYTVDDYASLWAHNTSTTLHLKKGHGTFRVCILPPATCGTRPPRCTSLRPKRDPYPHSSLRIIANHANQRLRGKQINMD